MPDNVTLDTVCAPSSDVVARLIEDDIVIVPLAAGVGDADDELYTLNESGRAIWGMLDGQRSLRDVVLLLAERFDAPADVLEADVLGFADALARRRILAVKD